MSSVQNKMDKNSYDQLLIMQVTIDANRQDSDEKMNNITEDLTSMITSIMDHIKYFKYSPYNKDSPKYQYPTNLFLSNNKAPKLEGVHSTSIGDMWNLKHDIISPKFFEFLINI